MAKLAIPKVANKKIEAHFEDLRPDDCDAFDVEPVNEHEFGSKPLARGAIEFLEGARKKWPGTWNYRLNCFAFFSARMGWTRSELIDLYKRVAPDSKDKADLAVIKSAFSSGLKRRAANDDKSPAFLTDIRESISAFRGDDGHAYAKLTGHDWPVAYPMQSEGFRSFVRKIVFERQKKPLNRSRLDDIVEMFEAEALFGSIEEPVCQRIGKAGDSIYYCSMNSAFSVRVRPRQSVEDVKRVIQSDSNPPINFRANRSMKPLPEVDDSDTYSLNERVDLLFKLVNVEDVGERLLLVSTLVANLIPDLGAYPVVVMQGEQGSGKSTASRIFAELIDPSDLALSNLPKTERDLSIMAHRNYLLTFDNISAISSQMSDALCKISTGGSFFTRSLYSNDDLTIFKTRRPILINGIVISPERADLLDRSIVFTLATIVKRKSDTKINEMIERYKSPIFTGLLQLVSFVLAHWKSAKGYTKFRMTDFARVGCLVERALALKKGAFSAAYNKNRNAISAALLENEQLVTALIAACSPDQEIDLSPTELLEKLTSGMTDRRGFFRSGGTLSKRLKRLKPELERHGVEIEFNRTSGQRTIYIKMPSQSSWMWSGVNAGEPDDDGYDGSS